MSDDPLRQALHELLGARPTPTKRRQIAEMLRQLASEQEAIAAAEARQQQKPPTERIGGGKGGRPSRAWVRIEERPRLDGDATALHVLLSRRLYYDAGRPERLDVQRVGGELLLIPARGNVGYKVVANAGGVSINASGSRDVLHGYAGRYAAQLRAGTIVIGASLDVD